MPIDELIPFLSTTELLRDVPENLLPSVAEQMQLVEFEPSAVVFAEGEVGDAAYIIVDGRLALVSEGVELVCRGRGGCVGEFSLIDDEPRSASGVARSHLTLLRWSRAHFIDTLVAHPGVARGIFRMLTAKLRSDVERGVDLMLERERWRQDFARAREIQGGMLPPAVVALDGVHIAGHCSPAADVGGDFYDFIDFGAGEVGVAIGDVTGHGFYSGLFVAMAKSCLHTQARFDHSPSQVMHALRRTMELSLQRRLLMTCSYVLVNARAGRICFANAGHPHPLHFRAAEGRVERLEVLDTILGVLDVDEAAFRARERSWEAGDVLVLYSDGITETRDPGGDEFGVDRVEALVCAHARGSPESLRDAILEAVFGHAAGAARRDDLTLVVVKAESGVAGAGS